MSGNVCSDLYLNRLGKKITIYTQTLNNWIYLKNKTTHVVKFILLEDEQTILNSDLILYFWPISKFEAIFHLKRIFSFLSKKTPIFLVGEKRSGIQTAKKLLKTWINLEKIDSAKHCHLFSGNIVVRPKFKFESFIYKQTWKDIFVKTIPGVFSYNKIDIGSQLLISTFSKSIKGDILDIGCGSGILSVSLAKQSSEVKLTLVDTNIAALISSQLTLECNNIIGDIFPSDVYSNIHKKFNFIMSNPSFHCNSKINLRCISTIIKDSVRYLKKQGEIRIVVNSSISCDPFFKCAFAKYNILKENTQFKVYQAYQKNKK
ncbi:MAG: 16S rRNA (guanine(1207)-N(2))-methyltransferase RsmC [Buchnera aphidicola (Kaburagia rhusicola ensigallis)]